MRKPNYSFQRAERDRAKKARKDEKKLQRTYKTDFEIYDRRSRDPQNAQLDLYIGMK